MQVRCAHDRLVPISDLKPHPRNRNIHPPEQIDRLAEILHYQGWRYPVKVSKRSGLVTSGHGRIDAAKKNGWTEVPVNFQDYESEEQEYADVQADNAIASWAELDIKGIEGDIKALPNLQIAMLGIQGLKVIDEEGQGDPDAVPEVPAVAKTKRGELWILGNHRLLIDDCTVKENVERLMAGEKADMVFTDPPYNLASDSVMLVKTELRGNSYGKLAESEWDKHFKPESLFPSLAMVGSEACSFYICTSDHLFGQFFAWLKANTDYAHYCVWVKTNPMPSLAQTHWTWGTELIAYGARKGHPFNFPPQGNALSWWQISKIPAAQNHPTEKPVAVPLHAIIHSSDRGMLIADLFLGSGSTLIACEKTNRRCFGMEIEPLYGDVIIERWEKFSGKKAVREDGMKWPPQT